MLGYTLSVALNINQSEYQAIFSGQSGLEMHSVAFRAPVFQLYLGLSRRSAKLREASFGKIFCKMAAFVIRGLVLLFNDSGSADKFEGFSSEDLETRGVSRDFTIFHRKIGNKAIAICSSLATGFSPRAFLALLLYFVFRSCNFVFLVECG